MEAPTAQLAHTVSAATRSPFGRSRRLGGTRTFVYLTLGAGAVSLALAGATLEHPLRFALQEAFIVAGPIVVGLYWRARRPASSFGPLLVVVGLLAIPVSLQASSHAWPHTVGVVAETPLLVATFAVILAFPTGKLDGLAGRAILGVLLIASFVWLVPVLLLSSELPGSQLITCTGSCPPNALHVSTHEGFLLRWNQAFSILSIGTAAAAAALIVARLAVGGRHRRRAMLAGSIGGVAFLIAYAAFVTIDLTHAGGSMPADAAVRWVPVIARALLPLGFLFALVQAELVAGRVLRKTVELLAHHPPLDEVEAALARALVDPGLRLAIRRESPARWIGVDGGEVTAPPPGGKQKLTPIIRGGMPPAAIIHDSALDDEPELLRAAGAAALLAFESATLETELRAATRELRESRARLVAAGDDERRRLERDIHEGALQQLVALRIKLAITSELCGVDPELRRRLDGLRVDVDQALDDLRELARGLYPPTLVDEGLLPALKAAAMRSPLEVRIVGEGVGRFPLDVEAAVYFCCLEALHNASKHAGRGAHVVISLTAGEHTLHFMVKDDGLGFDAAALREGTGFANMRDRVGALDGAIVVDAGPGKGTTVEGWVPDRSSASADGETRPERLRVS